MIDNKNGWSKNIIVLWHFQSSSSWWRVRGSSFDHRQR